MDINILKTHKLISILVIVIGITLMTYMVITEDEPGAIPLLLIISGTGWYLVTRSNMKAQKA